MRIGPAALARLSRSIAPPRYSTVLRLQHSSTFTSLDLYIVLVLHLSFGSVYIGRLTLPSFPIPTDRRVILPLVANMAIYREVPDIYRTADNVEAPIDVEAWTEEATLALASVNISAAPPQPTIRGTSVTLDIPLDDHVVPQPETTQNTAAKLVRSGYPRRKEPLRRDSLKRREALLKGKEGSRQRRRWENGAR